MNKMLIATLLVIGCVSYFGSNLTTKPKTMSDVETTSSIRSIHETYVTRRPSAESKEEVSVPIQRTFSKTRKKKSFEGMPHGSLPKGFTLSKNIFAIKKDDYSRSMGEVVDEKHGFVFFNSDSHVQGSNHVVIETKSQRLFTVSSVLKLENIDEGLRSTLLTKGFEEHYYHENLNVLYVQATQEDLFRLHEELVTYDLHPQVEILRGFHRPK